MQPLFKHTCLLAGGAGRSGTTILGSLLASHPQAAMLIEDSLTAILRAVQMLVSIRTVPEEAERAAIFGVPKSFVNGPFDIVRLELERLADMPGYRARFSAVFKQVMELSCNRSNAILFGSKSTLAENWEDLPYLRCVLHDLRLLLIVRNPLNVIASSLRRRDNARIGLDVWHIHSVEEAAAEWRAAMRTMARVLCEQSSPTLVLKYEELCKEPRLVQDIFKFSGLIPFEGYPSLWRRELGDTRHTLSAEEVEYLELNFPNIDEFWDARTSYELLSHFATV